jgi:two-component system sensor histidine kinase KdpD
MSPKLHDMVIADLELRERSGERVPIVLRIGARAWSPTDIHDQLNLGGSKQIHELGDRARRMSDREKPGLHAGLHARLMRKLRRDVTPDNITLVPAVAPRRPDPEKLLRQVQADERDENRGRLKVFLGYSSGVGKSFRMFDEGRRRKQRGQDVVAGALQPKASPEVEAVLKGLEVIPLLADFRMDVDAILRRRPQVCLVDGLAYDNPPGSQRAKRWQDVQFLLDAEISVITSINLQFIDECREQVEKITGKTVTQTVPLSFISTADEIVVVDAPPDLCMERAIEQGDETMVRKQQQLTELREIALVLAADVVDRQLERYLHEHGIDQRFGTQERILVCLTPRTNPVRMLESGKRISDRFHGEILAAYVSQPDLSATDQVALDKNFQMARQFGAEVVTLDGEDPVDAILKFAVSRGITQIFMGHTMREGPMARFSHTPVDKLLAKPQGIDIRVFPH